MGQVVSTTACAQAGSYPVSTGVHCLPPDLTSRFKKISKKILSDDVTDIIIRVAEQGAEPNHYPHDTTKPAFSYKYMDAGWWTSGFFPGSLWLLYERSLHMKLSTSSSDILDLALSWQEGMESQQYNKGTHDLGFMIMPAFYRDYQLRGSDSSKDIVINAAHSLSTRWNETVKCIRSWDSMSSPRWNFSDKNKNFLVIIDNMMNLELLYRGAELTDDDELARRATEHAKTTMAHHIRPDDSTYHLVNYNPANGDVQGRYTVQGYADNSTWARGQSWGVYGYTTAYKHTKDPEFLSTAKRLATYFIKRMRETADSTGMVYWDFDAPHTTPPIRDVSAAMVVCSGLLELYELTGDAQFLPDVAQMLEYAIWHSKAPKEADTVLRGATVNNNPDNKNPSFETGLVYADYYLLEVGNRLLQLNLA